MKELSIEEKAKRYDELLVKLQEAKVDNDICDERYCCVIDDIVPELKESEDERIRQTMIQFLIDLNNGVYKIPKEEEIADWIAWLEKQKPADTCDSSIINGKEFPAGEKRDFGYFEKKSADMVEPKDYNSIDPYFCKPIDKVEPKFKVGNRIINNNSRDVFKVTEIRDNEYCLWPLDAEIKGYVSIIDVNDNYHLWSIEDTRDSDVLMLSYASKHYILIYKRLYEKGFRIIMSVYCFYCVEEDTYYDETDNFHVMNSGEIITPATKEQRDTLFKAMKEAGYVWLPNKKQLVKLLFKEGDTVRKKSDGSIWHINYINERGYWDNHKPIFPIENQNEFELIKPEPTPAEVTKESGQELTVPESESHSILIDKTINWNEIRIQAAIAAMQGILANAELVDSYRNYGINIERASVAHANILIEELKKKG